MAKDPLLPDAPRDGDSWESLASNLLGINLNKPLDAEIVSAEELDALELDVDEEPAEPPVPPPEPPPVLSEEPADDVKPDDEIEAVEPAADSEAAEPDRANDPYWDPLAEWEWDDGPSTKRPPARKPAAAQPSRPAANSERPAAAQAEQESIVKGPGADARRAADSFDTVSDYRDEYETGDDWEFGAGLLEGVAPPEPAKPKPAEEDAGFARPTAAAPEPRRPQKRDRDERPPKRDRDAERRPAETREPAPPQPAVQRFTDDAPADDDAFGAGLVESGASPEPSAAGEGTDEQRRPRRRGRRRGRASKGDASPESRTAFAEPDDEPRTNVPSDDSAADFDDDEEAADDGHADSPYRNIPSWEEAIGYLINPKRSADSSSSRSADGKESASRSDSGGSGRSSGRRRRRRPSR
jgi:hypothetical protein